MPTAIIPALLRPLCAGASRLEVEGATLGDVLRALDLRCPGLYDRVVENGHLRPELAVAIDGEAGSFPLHEPLSATSELTILPAISGGAPDATILTMASPVPRVEPLEPGDRMTRAEFHRRYLEHPEIRKAELIEGVVYLPSPVRIDQHGRPHGLMTRWLSVYCEAHPEVEFVPETTMELDNDNEPQPDIMVRYIEGGSSRQTAGGYVAGAPELVIEIAASSRAYDMHDKLRAYRRNGVQEYIVWQVLEERIVWFELRNGEYVPLAADASGVIHSRVLPDLRLALDSMLSGDIATVQAVQRS
ncbi:MAG: Uma2 family endonuclease [Dehalococcoidia bacterium]